MVPQYGPRLYIFPSLRYPGEFQFWSLQLLSLTLLEPQVAEPNHEVVDPMQWAAKRIVMPSPPRKPDDREIHCPGIRVVFDTCEWILRHSSIDPDDPNFDVTHRQRIFCFST